jgi:very-short-patch-repair endonuclease
LLEQASVKSSRAEVLAMLDEMRRRRLITIDRGGHWHVRQLYAQSRSSGDPLPPTPGNTVAGAPLHAVRAKIRSVPDCTEDDVFGDMADTIGQPPFDRLLSYYEATQRADPRGSISQSPDRHEHQFQLFHGTEQWWRPSSMLTIELGDFPPTFRHALSKRNGGALIIGYPLAIMVEDGVREVFPVGLIGASVSRTGFVFQVTPQSADVVLNPDWIRRAGHGTDWSAKALAEQFDAAEGLAFDDFRNRLSDCMAARLSDRLVPNDLVGSIDPGAAGIHNAAAIFLPPQTCFTRGTATDLEQLAQMPASELEGTALWSLLHGNAAEETAGTVLNPVPLTPNQLEAAELAATGAVTAITAPPGTGKNRVIVSIIASALAAEKTVLFAARDHQAIDAVEERLSELAPEQPIMVRANGGEGDQDTDFVRVIAGLAGDDTRLFAKTVDDSLHRLRDKAEVRSRAFRDRAAAQHLDCVLSGHIRRRAEILARVGERRPRSGSMSSRLLCLLPFRRAAPAGTVLAPGASVDELDAAIERDRKALARVAAARAPTPMCDEIFAGMKALFPALAANALAVDAEDCLKLHGEQKELELWGRINAREMTDYVALQVLACRPIWAVTTLSTPSRVPLAAGIFDYVIFDEASQCDIASALPLMARAKRAVVIGDPNQPASISGLGPAQERTLMNTAGLPLQGMGRYAQSRNSLFEFCVSQPGTRSVMLRDQFRSAPAIVDYLNDAFYDGQLQAARDEARLKAPAVAKPGIFWTDVRGRVSLDQAGQSQNHEEAKAIARHLDLLLGEQDYQGSIGMITPFNAQAELLKRLIENDFPRRLRERAALRIGTVDMFRGEECDVILFSPVAGPGLCEDARAFLLRDKRRFNVAISRAHTVVHVFGNHSFARESGIRHLTILAEKAACPRVGKNAGDVFDSAWQRRVDAALRARGLNPTPQYPTAGRYLDFALFGEGQIKLKVEVDSRRWHIDAEDRRKIDDMRRYHNLNNPGWRVRRFCVDELEQDLEGCLDQVERDLAG